MLTGLADKVADVMAILADQGFVAPISGRPIDGNNRKTLLYLINLQRARRRAGGQIHLPGLSKYLNYPAQAPVTFLNELTSAIGLTDLGFDETIWTKGHQAVIELVGLALAGGVLSTVLKHHPWHRLFELYPRRAQGFGIDDQTPELDLLSDVPEITVVAGDKIQTCANMRFPGYLRVCAGVEDKIVGMNDFMRIPTGKIPSGHADFGLASTSPQVARTVVYAFACREPNIFNNWPTNHLKEHRLPHGQFLQLVNEFFKTSEESRDTSVQSFLTTVGIGRHLAFQ